MRLRITSTANLITLLRRLKTVERSVILELKKDGIFCKVHTPDKSVMKYSSVKFDDILEGEIDWKKIKCDRIKIGIIDVTRLIDAFKHFRPEEEIFMEIETDNLEGSCVSTEVKLISASLSIRLKCADLSLLSYVEDNILDLVHSREDALLRFKIYQSDFTTITSLCGLETNSEEILCFNVKDTNVYAIGDSFNYKLNIGSSEIILEDGESSPNIYKKELSYMEPETCEVYVHDNRMVMVSEQSSTSIAMGLVEK
jgi:hypothetical protein